MQTIISFEELQKLAHAQKIEREAVERAEALSKDVLKEKRFMKAAKRNVKSSNRKGNKAQQRAAWMLEAE